MDKYKCTLCSNSYNNYTSLSRHATRTHKVDSVKFYVDYNLNGKWPLCKCGCGEMVKWKWQNPVGFRDFIAGHQSRIHSNFTGNTKAFERSAETRRKQFANGEREVWNKGLTAETDERVRLNGEMSKISINSNPEEIKRRSISMSKNRKNGVIPTGYGKDSPNWKGGVSSINALVRGIKSFYDSWKYPILKRDSFKCTKCSNSKDLHVHHNKETMAEIIKKVMTIDDYEHIDNYDRKQLICEKIIKYHVDNNVSGETICWDCHKKLHPSLNFDY